MDTEDRKQRPLTIKEVAWYLRINRATVVRMLKDGRLKGSKVGRHWRIPVESLRALLNIGEDNGEQDS